MTALSPIRPQPLVDRFIAARADLPQPAGVERAAPDTVQPLGEGEGGERAGDRRTGERTTALDQLHRAFGAPRARQTDDVVQISAAARGAAESRDDPEAATEGAGDADGAEAADDATLEDEPTRRADDAPKKANGDALTDADLRLIDKLEARDREVRAHEQAHKAVGGRYAGAISYDYQRGPDGEQYAVGGEVSIDIAEVPGDPAATIRKMQIVRRAALAPAEPSGADRAAAAKASQRAAEAQGELRAQQVEDAKRAREETAEAGEEAAEARTDAADDARPADDAEAEAAADPVARRGGVDGSAIRRVSGQAGVFVGRRAADAIGGDAIDDANRIDEGIDAVPFAGPSPSTGADRVALSVAQ